MTISDSEGTEHAGIGAVGLVVVDPRVIDFRWEGFPPDLLSGVSVQGIAEVFEQMKERQMAIARDNSAFPQR